MVRRKKYTPKDKRQPVAGSDNEELSASDEESGIRRNAIDKFHKQKELELLKKSSLNVDHYDSDDIEEEGFMDVGSDGSEDEDLDEDDDEEDEEDALNSNYYQIQAKKDEMESDLDSNDEDEEAFLPDPKAWGKKKSAFYNTDYVDKGYKRIQTEEEDVAKAEEDEADAIQKRLLSDMNDADLELEWITGRGKDEPEEEEDTEGVPTDTASLNLKGKLAILKKESPEMFPLIEDFFKCMTDVQKTMEPTLAAMYNSSLPLVNTSGFDLLTLKYHLTLRYAQNISFYMMLKSKGTATKDHPVIQTLLKYKRLISEIDQLQVNKELDKEADKILGIIDRGEELFIETESSPLETNLDKKPTKKAKKEARPASSKVSAAETVTERLQRLASGALEPKQPRMAEEPSEEEEEADESDEEEGNERRGITYQIAKNKGLTAQKKKELRNPRVKHRLKYKKAQVRRKGQVRQPRKELTKYGGELSGIKPGLVRSIKFKR
ncbi:Something about silencing protein 10 [Halotydeus destructor]|nr:Something about silencing protein 10 [Halotydeus destructor]